MYFHSTYLVIESLKVVRMQIMCNFDIVISLDGWIVTIAICNESFKDTQRPTKYVTLFLVPVNALIYDVCKRTLMNKILHAHCHVRFHLIIDFSFYIICIQNCQKHHKYILFIIESIGINCCYHDLHIYFFCFLVLC